MGLVWPIMPETAGPDAAETGRCYLAYKMNPPVRSGGGPGSRRFTPRVTSHQARPARLPRVDLDLDLSQDGAALTAALADIPSVSGDEERLANVIDAALRRLPHLDLYRDGNALVARTTLDRPERVVLAGHIDTVPIAGNLPARLDGDMLYGCGTCDMKSGVAVQLRLAAELREPRRDVTYVFYDGEEVEAERNGLLRLSRNSPDLLDGDLAVLLEPTSAIIEGGCQGTMRAEVRATGERAHSARSWNGTNAIHQAGPTPGCAPELRGA